MDVLQDRLDGMPIEVGRSTGLGSSSVDTTYGEILTDRDKARSRGVFVLTDGASRLVLEWSLTATFPTVPLIWPARVTNVNGRFVKTHLRRPRAT